MKINRSIFLIICLVFAAFFSQAQELTIQYERDTVNVEEQFVIKYSIDKSCDPGELKFENFIVTGGPSTSKSFSIINGKSSSQTSATYVITPIEEGTFELPSEWCDVKLEKPVKIVVKKGYESKEDLDKRIRKKRKIKKI